MTRDDIIRMAREASFHVEDDDYGNPMLVTDSGDLTKFAQLVAAHERDECLKIVELAANKMAWRGAMESVAFLIRSRNT